MLVSLIPLIFFTTAQAAPPPVSSPLVGPTLRLGPLQAGALTLVEVEAAPPGEAIYLALGTSGVGDGPCPAALGGVCLGLAGEPRLLLRLWANAAGRASGVVEVPPGIADGRSVAYQAAGAGWTTAVHSGWTGGLARTSFNGAWADDFGGSLTVWPERVFDSFGGLFWVVESAEEGQSLLALNDEGNAYFPGRYSRFDWTVDGEGRTWYCQVAYNAATAAAARAVPAADPDDRDRGCGGFPWSGLDPIAPALSGSWVDAWGTGHHIDRSGWTSDFGVWNLTSWDDASGWMVGQNDPSNDYFPGKWSRFDWISTEDGLFYCQTAFAARSEAEARGTPAADPADPTRAGCGGFPWTRLDG